MGEAADVVRQLHQRFGWRFWVVWRVLDGRVVYRHAYCLREEAIADLEGDAS